MRCPLVPNVDKPPLFCSACCVSKVQFVCTACRSVHYCGKQCQKSDWKKHKMLCNTISGMAKERDEKIEEKCSFVSHVTPKVKQKLIQLVGERCMIECEIAGYIDDALWDTGAQVSLICEKWLAKLGIDIEIKSLESLIGTEAIKLSGAGGRNIPYLGYVTLPVLLKGRTEPLDVPFLVTEADLSSPIIGYNVIKAVADNEEKNHEFFKGLSHVAVCEVMKLLADPDSDHLSYAKMVKTGHVVRKKSSSVVTLKINTVHVEKRTPVIFEPSLECQLLFDDRLVFGEQLIMLKKGVNQKIKVSVVNTSDKDLEIPARMIIGDVEMVSTVTPMAVRLKDNSDSVRVVESSTDKTECECNEVELEVESEEKYLKLKQQLQEIDLNHLDKEVQEKVRNMLWRKKAAFVSDNGEIGEAKDLNMKINTIDDIPVQKNYYKIPKPLIEEVKNHVRDMLDRGWIKESSSANSSPVVLVRKKGGGLRVCCDFRELNRKTIPDKHPLPRIDDTLENLGGSSWFSVIDQTRAYYQGFIDPGSRWKTAFVTPWGLYEWVRIPFGLMNSPSAFQRHMEETLREYRDDFAAPYLDDVIVYSKSLNEHITHVEKVLDKFIEKGLKIGFDKCNFFQQQVKFLGRIVTSEGYRMDEESVDAVRALKNHVPQTLGEVRQLLGLVGYHRRQIQDFARLAHPLTELLKTGGRESGEKNTSKRPVVWLEEHRVALGKLIDAISSQPILAYPDYNEKFFIHTDASGLGLGCILYQIQKGKMRVIAYGSRSLLPAEKNYHSTKLEFLALKWAVCDKFRDYVGYGNAHFTIFTDNNPLLYVMRSTKLNANGQRWVSELSEFNFTVKYRPGVINKDADCLSRIPLDISKYQGLCEEEMTPDAFHALVAGVAVQERGEESWFVNAALVKSDFAVEDNLSLEQIRSAQENDDVIRQVKELLEVKQQRDWKNLDPSVRQLLHHRRKLFVDSRGILCRENNGTKQVVWPESLRYLIYRWFHEEMGHVGPNRVSQLCRSRVFWPKMLTDIEEFINKKCQCIAQKRPHRHQEAELQSIHTSAPLELITVDYLKP